MLAVPIPSNWPFTHCIQAPRNSRFFRLSALLANKLLHTTNKSKSLILIKNLFIFVFIFCKDRASRRQRKLVFFVEAKPIFCKDSASRRQRKFTFFVEAKPIFCKDSGCWLNCQIYLTERASPKNYLMAAAYLPNNDYLCRKNVRIWK